MRPHADVLQQGPVARSGIPVAKARRRTPHTNPHTREIALRRGGVFALPGSGSGCRAVVARGIGGDAEGGDGRCALGSY